MPHMGLSFAHQIGDAVIVGLGSASTLCPANLARASVRVIDPFHWLHFLSMARVFERSYGEPPRERGRSSSTSTRLG